MDNPEPPWTFKRHGQSGMEFSELLPNLATCADDMCMIRSMVADNINHNGACLQMNTGEQTFSRPSLGSWLLYGLGSENQNLPGFVVLGNNQGIKGGPLNWHAGFLPAAHQGTLFRSEGNPILNLTRPQTVTRDDQRRQLDLLGDRIHPRLNATRHISRFELRRHDVADDPPRRGPGRGLPHGDGAPHHRRRRHPRHARSHD